MVHVPSKRASANVGLLRSTCKQYELGSIDKWGRPDRNYLLFLGYAFYACLVHQTGGKGAQTQTYTSSLACGLPMIPTCGSLAHVVSLSYRSSSRAPELQCLHRSVREGRGVGCRELRVLQSGRQLMLLFVPLHLFCRLISETVSSLEALSARNWGCLKIPQSRDGPPGCQDGAVQRDLQLGRS